MMYFKVCDYSKERTLEVQDMIENNRRVANKSFIKTLVINDRIGYALVCRDKDYNEITKELNYIFGI